MFKYVNDIQEDGKCLQVGEGTNSKFYESIGMVQRDVEKSEVDGCWYLKELCPHYTDEEKQEIIAREELSKEEASQNYTEAVTLSAKTYTPAIQFNASVGQYLASGAENFRIYQQGELIAESRQFVISESGTVSVEAYSSTAGDFIINVRRI